MTNADHDLRTGLRLEYATLAWNVVGTAVLAYAALGARSIGLAGFALDSLIEIFASVVVVWQLKGIGQDREPLAMRLIGAAFVLLAIYILCQTAITLVWNVRPLPSPLGVAWTAVTGVIMLLLARGKQVVGRKLANPVLLAEARVTLIDAALAFAVLAGAGLNLLAGWWWADPLAGLVIIYYAVREGSAAWKHGSLAA